VSNPGAGNRPVGGIAVPDFPVDDLRRCLSGFAFGDEVSALVAGTYRGGRTLGTAFVDLMRRLLPDSGLLYVDPMQPAIRAIAAPLMRHAVDSAKSFIDLVLERNAELEAAGYHAQVHVELKTSPFFLLKDGQRLATLPGNGGFAHLAAQAEHLSPNALLRPVVQDYLLPTAVLVGGPAELAYLAQTGVIYHALDRPMPVVLPRAGLTLLDARAEKLLGRYHLSIPDFFDGSEPVRQRIAAQLVPTGLQQTLRNSHAAAEKLLDGLQHEVARFDPTLGAALNRSRAKILHQLTRIEAKTAREALRRDARAQAEAAYLSGLLFPEKHLQERLYTILPFLARHGLGLLDTLRESVSLECPDHVVLTL
jgi:bacillithiol biosynthesis cysteine-adding enzyme BshC